MRLSIPLFVLAAAAAGVRADRVPTEVVFPGWRVESSEDLFAGRIHKGYPLTYLFDGKPETAWVFSGKAKGADRKVMLTLRAEQAVTLDGIRIMNGYNKSPEVFRRNSRITAVRVELHAGERGAAQRGSESVAARLPDARGWHAIDVPRRMVREITIEVTEMAPGPDDDVCISGLELCDGGKAIDMGMPPVVLATDGDECGCGWEGYYLRNTGGRTVTPRALYSHAAPVVDPTRRFMALAETWTELDGNSRNHAVAIIDLRPDAVTRLVRRHPLPGLAGGVNALRWDEPDIIRVHWDAGDKRGEVRVRAKLPRT